MRSMGRAVRSAALSLGLIFTSLTGMAWAAPPAPPALEAYSRLPAMEKAALSPSGDKLAFVAFDGAHRQLFVRTTAGVALATMDLTGANVRDVYWGGERFALVSVSYSKRLDPDLPILDLFSVFAVDLQTGKVQKMFGKGEKAWDAVFGEYGTRQIDGRWYGLFVSFEMSRDTYRGFSNGSAKVDDYNPDLFKIDLETGAIDRLARGLDSTRGWTVDGVRPVARLRYVRTTGDWAMTTVDGGGKPLAQGHEAYGDVGLAGLGRTPGTGLLALNDDQGFATLREINLSDGKVVQAFGKGQDIAYPLFDRTSNLMIGYTLAGQDQRSVLFDPAAQAKVDKALRAFPGKRPLVISYSQDFRRMIVMTNGGDDSGTYWLIDHGAGKADMLGERYPAITPSKVGLSRLYTYKASDGQAIEAILTLPPGQPGRNLPVVVLPHGGPEAYDTLGFHFWAQAFASRGYAVLQPNFRGSAGYGKAFRDKGLGEWGRRMQTDLSDGLAALAAEGVIDPKRACIAGAGYGGYAALAGVTVQQGTYRCAVAFAAYSDLTTTLSDTAPRGPQMRYMRDFIGPDVNAVSPAAQASKADAPVLLLHGKDDSVVDVEQSQKMARTLRGAGKSVELVVMPGEDHWLSTAEARTALLQASLTFVLKNNPPD